MSGQRRGFFGGHKRGGGPQRGGQGQGKGGSPQRGGQMRGNLGNAFKPRPMVVQKKNPPKVLHALSQQKKPQGNNIGRLVQAAMRK